MEQNPPGREKISRLAQKYRETLAIYRLLDHDVPYAIDAAADVWPADEDPFLPDDDILARLHNAQGQAAAHGRSFLITVQCSTRDEVDAAYQKMIDAGYESVQAPFDAAWGARFALVADADGNPVGLESPTDSAGYHWPSPTPPEQQAGHVEP